MGRIDVKRLRYKAGAYYWQPTPAIRRLGFAPEPLGKDMAVAVRRAEALNRDVEAEKRRLATGEARGALPGSVGALIDLYQRSAEYQELASTTKVGYDSHLRMIRAKEERTPVREIRRADLRDIYQALIDQGHSHKPAAVLRMWAILLAFAVREEWITKSPAKDMRLHSARPRAILWTGEQRRKVIKTAMRMERRSVALGVVLLWVFGQRPVDTVRMQWSAWDGDSMEVEQSKTGTRLRVQATRYGRLWLARTPRQAVQIIVDERTGRPYTRNSFTKAFREVRDAAGLPPTLQLRDMRRTTTTELGSSGATDQEMMAVTGHKTRSMISLYAVPTAGQSVSAQARREQTRPRSGKST